MENRNAIKYPSKISHWGAKLMKKWPIYSDFSILSHNSGNFGQNEKQVLFSEGATSGTEPSSFPESSMVMCKNVVYQWSAPEHCPTISLQAHCEIVLLDELNLCFISTWSPV